MSLWQRLWHRPRPRGVDRLPELLAGPRDALVRFSGRVEVLEPIYDPVSGEVAVAVEYRASPQSNVLGVAGALAAHSRAFQLTCQQATDFLVCDGEARVLVRVDRGRDVAALHRELLARHGVDLRSERALVRPGALVCVVGRLVHTSPTSPLRAEAHVAEVRAQRFWLVEPEDEDARSRARRQ